MKLKLRAATAARGRVPATWSPRRCSSPSSSWPRADVLARIDQVTEQVFGA